MIFTVVVAQHKRQMADVYHITWGSPSDFRRPFGIIQMRGAITYSEKQEAKQL